MIKDQRDPYANYFTMLIDYTIYRLCKCCFIHTQNLCDFYAQCMQSVYSYYL